MRFYMIDKTTASVLLDAAAEARKNSYAPYSHFLVGAALLTDSGKIYTGCNIENASFTPTNCAERTAIFKAVSEGEKNFTAIAVVGGAEESSVMDLCPPCGVCRQVLREFCDDSFEICLSDKNGNIKILTLGEILPYGFMLD